MSGKAAGNLALRKKIYSDAVEYYKVHPDEFCEDVLMIKLNLYQCIMMRAAFKYSYIVFIMCRGLGRK